MPFKEEASDRSLDAGRCQPCLTQRVPLVRRLTHHLRDLTTNNRRCRRRMRTGLKSICSVVFCARGESPSSTMYCKNGTPSQELSLDKLVGVGLRHGPGVGDKACKETCSPASGRSAHSSGRSLLFPVSWTSRPHLERGATSSTSWSPQWRHTSRDSAAWIHQQPRSQQWRDTVLSMRLCGPGRRLPPPAQQ